MIYVLHRLTALIACFVLTYICGHYAKAYAGPPLWGTVEFATTIQKSTQWTSVLKRNKDNNVFFDENRLNKSTTWKTFRNAVVNKPLQEMLSTVNLFWNKFPYRSDIDAYRRADYWAAPYEFMQKSGDCEDYAIAKYFTLKALGVPPNTMRIVVVRETVRNIGHAILAVYDGDTIYILDNLSSAVRRASRIRNYQPQYSINESKRWMHVRSSGIKK